MISVGKFKATYLGIIKRRLFIAKSLLFFIHIYIVWRIVK